MKVRALGATLVASTVLFLLPAGAQASHGDRTCSNGSEPVEYSFTDLRPLATVELRVLCIQD